MLRVEHDDVAGPPGERVAQIVERAATDLIAVGAVGRSAGNDAVDTCGSGRRPWSWASPRCWRSPRWDQGGIRQVLARCSSWNKGPTRKYDNDGEVFTNPARFLCYRLQKSLRYARGRRWLTSRLKSESERRPRSLASNSPNTRKRNGPIAGSWNMSIARPERSRAHPSRNPATKRSERPRVIPRRRGFPSRQWHSARAETRPPRIVQGH